MKILSIINKEEDLLVDDELMKSQEMFPDYNNLVIQGYEDIISHDDYWVTQDQPGEIKDLALFENQGSVYVFDSTKTGSSNTCFRVDLYDNNLVNSNAAVNIISFLEKGKWFDNSLICKDRETDIQIIDAIVKCHALKERLMEKILNNSRQEVAFFVEEENNIVSPNQRVNRLIDQEENHVTRHYHVVRDAQPMDLYFRGADAISGQTVVIYTSIFQQTKNRKPACKRVRHCTCDVQ